MPSLLLARLRGRRKLLQATRGRRSVARRRMPRGRYPRNLEVEYFGVLLELLTRARRELERVLLPELPSIVAEAARGDAREDAKRGSRRLNELVDGVAHRFLRSIEDSTLEVVTERVARATDRHVRNELGKQVKAVLGVELESLTQLTPGLSGRIEDFTAENVSLIRTLPTRFFEEVETRMVAGIREGKRHETIAEELQERFGVAKSRAALIARDQVGKFHGELQRAQQEQLGVASYVWRTVRDNRVRSEHEEREGERFRWDDPPEDGHPGHAINCRCYPEPDFAELLAEL